MVTGEVHSSPGLMRRVKQLLVRGLPLAVRKPMAIAVNKQSLIAVKQRGYLATELLSDFAESDIDAYHKFLWKHHLAYAETYDVATRFGYPKFNQTRRMFLAELIRNSEVLDLPARQWDSVLEVGCSLGYILRHLETAICPNASRLAGVDIDANAIENGKNYLTAKGSRVELTCGDMEEVDDIYMQRSFDVVVGLGILLYLEQDSATRLVAKMLRSTKRLLAISALAHQEFDNRGLEESVERTTDQTWIHNVDKMVEDAGATIVGRHWEPGFVDGNTIYFVFAVPPEEG